MYDKYGIESLWFSTFTLNPHALLSTYLHTPRLTNTIYGFRERDQRNLNQISLTISTLPLCMNGSLTSTAHRSLLHPQPINQDSSRTVSHPREPRTISNATMFQRFTVTATNQKSRQLHSRFIH